MAALTPTYISGYKGSVEVDSIAQPMASWSADDVVATWDAANATTAGFAFPERGIRSMNGSFEMPLKAADDLPIFVAGLAYPLELFTQTGQGWSFNALLSKKSTKLDQKGGVMMTVNFESQGTITEVNPA